MLTNRDLAGLFWLGVLVVALGWGIVARSEIRSGTKGVVVAVMKPLIIGPVVAVAGYVALLVVGADALGFWKGAMLKDTIEWFISSGLGLVFVAVAVADGKRSMGEVARRALRLTLLVEFFVSMYVFSLPVELVLVPFITLLLILQAVAGMNDDYAQLKRVLGGVSALFGGAILLCVAVRLVWHLDTLAGSDLFDGALLPVWLNIGVLPITYLFAVWIAFDSTGRRLAVTTGRYAARRRSMIALARGLRLRVGDLHEFHGHWLHDLAAADSHSEALGVVRRFHAGAAARRAALTEEHARIQRYAGVDGADEDGRRLDQREFPATRAALQWLAVAQSGWYRNQGGRYRSDLLEKLAPAFARHGLPAEHGIELFVAHDGQSWWAWRRTIANWCFAIGNAEAPTAAGPAPQWLFDGPAPPRGFPGADDAWGENPWGLDALNW